MSARRRQTHPGGRSRQEIAVAVAVGLGLVIVTAVLVWILAPGSSSSPTVPAVPTPVAETPATTGAPPVAATTVTTAPGG